MAAARKSSKKRPATSQAGPTPKKVHLDKPGRTEKKRGRPVTLPAKDFATGSDSEGDSDDRDVGTQDDEWIGEADDVEGEGLVGNEMPPDCAPFAAPPPKDPNAAREAHKVQRVLHEQRRAAKPHSTLLVDAKRVWSLARQKNIPTAERQKYIHELMDVIRGRVNDIVFKHDASRIVQTVVKHGGQKQRDEIAAELKGEYKELAQNKYSKFLITKLIRLCPAHRSSILLEFQSHVLRLLLHREASSVVADAFELYANAYERSILLRDFYGKETALFSVTSGSGEDKERAKRGLSGVLEGVDNERRRRVLGAVKEGLVTVFNNPDKGAVTHAIVHRALWEYLVAVDNISDETEREKLRREIFDSCQDVLAEMVHTKDGSRVVREFLAQGSAKDRKQILKVLKPHVERMCNDDEAQLVLFTAVDVIDDTKLVAKTLIQDITATASTLYLTPQGRRALFYLLVPRTRRHFTPAQIASLAQIDEIRARTSKKTVGVREGEVRKAASESLLAWVADQGESVVREPGGSLVVVEIMLFADGDKTAATQTLLRALSPTYPSSDAALPHPIDLPHTSRLYKTLLQGGHFNRNTQTVEQAPRWDPEVFSEKFVDVVGKDLGVAMCVKGDRNGTFVIAELCERLMRARSEGRESVKRWFGADVLELIAQGEAKGKKVLLEKIVLL